MEAVAVVGLVSNVLQFVELGYKLLSASKEMYGSGNDATQSNRDLEFMARELKRTGQNLVKGRSPSPATDDEQVLLELADRCEKWANDMLAFLARLKNQKPESKLEAFKASVRNYNARHERSRLKEGLDNCRVQLDVQLNIMSRSDILKSLNDLTRSLKLTNEDMAVLKHSARSLQETVPSLEMKVGSRFLEQLRDILLVSEKTVLENKQKLFLHTLRHEGMEDRFYHVEPAHAATFRWLLESNPITHDSKSLEDVTPGKNDPRQQIRDQFTNWLRNESCIFHISGKPGAGKSTLMKFLCDNELTLRFLEEWSKGKQLIFAKAFFWRLGKDTQTLISLVRSLLYQVLSAARDLIPIAFPSRWEHVDSYGATTASLELGEIERGFQNILTNEATFEAHKLVFFIDGLDEYQGRHVELVEKIFSWTSLNTGNLKVCVSSREWNEFMVGFSECPKLRIHEYTYQDINIMACDQLKIGSHYPTLVNDRHTKLIADKIAHKAEGVFQWVSLVLNAVKDGILNGDDVSELDSKIDCFPNELGNLYQHLFESIHENDRQKVYEALRMTTYMGLYRGLPLMRFWFLNKVIDDPNYAKKMKLMNDSDKKTTDILEISRRQIYGRCKGFLIVQNNQECYPSRNFSTPFSIDGEVRFMHSTAYEFLEKPHIKQEIDQFLGNVNVFDRICQTFLAYTKFARPEWYDYDRVDSHDCPFNEELSRIFRFALEKARTLSTERTRSRFIEFLNELEITIIGKRGSLKTTYKVHNCFHTLPKNVPPLNMTLNGSTVVGDLIKLFAVSWSVHEFFQDKGTSYLLPAFKRMQISDNLMCLLLGRLSYRGRRMKIYYERLCRMLEWCFSRGIVSPNYVDINKPGLRLVDSLLLTILYRLSYTLWYNETEVPLETHLYPLRLLELCLRYGADPQLQLWFYDCRGEEDKDFVLVRPVFTNKGIHEGWYSSKRSPISVFAKQRNGLLTVRDLIELWFPRDYKALHRLLDENEKCMISKVSTLHTSAMPSCLGGELGRDWSEAELREDLFQWHVMIPGCGLVDCKDIDPEENEFDWKQYGIGLD